MELLSKIDEIIDHDKPFRLVRKTKGYFLSEPKVKGYPETFVKYSGTAAFYQFDIDNYHNLVFPFLNNQVAGAVEMCDYIVLRPKAETLYVFLCDMKSSKPEDATSQVQAAQLFAEFLVKTAQRLLDFKDYKVQYRGLGFTTKKKHRFKTNVRDREPYYPLPKTGLPFKILAAGKECNLDYLCY
jgi:hypothetical protein